MASVAPSDLLDRIDRHERPVVLDVRSAAEFAVGHVPGAVNIPFGEIASGRAHVPCTRDNEVVVYCGHGPRAWVAGAGLRRLGFRHVVYLRGHWSAWRRSRLRVET